MTIEGHIENLKAMASDMPSDKCSDWIESLMAGINAMEELQAHREAWELLKEDVMSKYYTYKINMDGHSMEMMEEILGLIYAHRPKEGDAE